MRYRTVVLFIAGFIALIALAVVYTRLTTVDFARHYAITDALRQLEALDTRWNENALRIRLSLNAHYDTLTEPLEVMERLQWQLERGFAQLDDGSELQAGLTQLVALSAVKVDEIEAFKGANAILGNSLRFLPLAIADAQRIAADSGAEEAIRQRLGQLKDGLLEYILLGQEELVAAARERIVALEAASQRLPTPATEAMAIALAHARTILRQKPLVDEVLEEILALPTTQQLRELLDLYGKTHEAEVLASESYRQPLVIVAVVLLFALLYLGYRLQRSYRALDRANGQLQRVNESLEERVTERTQELSQALNHLKESEAQLIQSEKMSSLGQMVAGVAHEINTPLAYTRSNIQLINEQLPLLEEIVSGVAELGPPAADGASDLARRVVNIADPAKVLEEDGMVAEMRELCELCLEGLDNITHIVRSLKDFSRLDRDHVEPINLNEGLDNVLVIAQNAIKGRATVERRYGELEPVQCSPSQINQVFLNLIMNAVQALPDQGGVVTLYSHDVGDGVEVVVEDNGKGIAPEHLTKIFDPFFTTKPVGEGTGLGLAIVYKIVKAHQGNIRVESVVGQGTRFTLNLPKRPAQLDSAAA